MSGRKMVGTAQARLCPPYKFSLTPAKAGSACRVGKDAGAQGATDGVPTISSPRPKQDGGHGASAPLPTLRSFRSRQPKQDQRVGWAKTRARKARPTACPPFPYHVRKQDGGHVASRLCPPYEVFAHASQSRISASAAGAACTY